MADTGNAKVLTARVVFDTSDAEKKINKLSDKINNLNKAFSNVAKDNDGLNNSLKQSTNQAKKLENVTDKVDKNIRTTVGSSKQMANQLKNNDSIASRLRSRFDSVHTKIKLLPGAMRSFANSIRTSTSAARETEDVFDRIYSKVKGIAAAYLGLMGAEAIITLSDNMTSAQNRLNDYNSQQFGKSGIATDANGNATYSSKTINATTEQMNKMFGAAQRARVGYDEMMKNVSKSMVLAGDAFNDNIDNAIYFQEIMGKAYTLGGASAAEMSSSMYQMIQALGAGTLAGDELRSVREGAPLAYQAIEEFAQGVYKCEDSLKDMASQGLITSDIVVAAMMSAGDEIEDRFEMTAMTFAQAFTMMKNTAIMAFKPILQYMNDFLNSETGQKALEIINEIIVAVSYGVGLIVRAIAAIITFVVDNWNWIKPILVSICVFIAEMILLKIGGAIVSLLDTTVKLILKHPVLALVTVLVALIIGLIVQIAQTSKNVHDFLCKLMLSIMAIALGVLVVIAIVSLATGNLVVGAAAIWALAIIAIFALILYIFLKHMDVAYGCWEWLKAGVTNLIRGIGNFILGLGEVAVVVANNIGVAFTNAWHYAATGFWGFVGAILDGLSIIEKPLNSVLNALGMGSIDISGASETALAKAANHQSQIQDYNSMSDAWNHGFNTYEYKDMDVAYKYGAQKGGEIQNKLKDMQVGDLFSNITGMDGLTDLGAGIPDPNAPEYALTPDDPSSMLGNSPGSTLDDIAGDTSKISDSMDIMDTDLKYLKELGEREAINKFTTAEIKVEMKNDNYISERVDMDGVVSYLSDKLYEELGVVANGVHY